MKYLLMILFSWPFLGFSQTPNVKDFEGKWFSENKEYRMELALDFYPDFQVKKMFPEELQETLPLGMDTIQDVYLITVNIYDKKLEQYIIRDSAIERNFRGYVSPIPLSDLSLQFLLIENEIEKGRTYRTKLTLVKEDILKMESVPSERTSITIGDKNPAPFLPIRVPPEVVFERRE